jgi:putative oxygen-independent coproporphyrinogen III oxidase
MMPIGVYVHFPWCLKKCPYCDFVSYAEQPELIEHERYADAVIAEFERRSEALRDRKLATVFFGGGTPSLWAPKSMGRVLNAIVRTATNVVENLEVTAECNPTSLDGDKARALMDVGVNRLSIGVQGTDRDRLEFLGRLHDPTGGLVAVEAAVKAGVPRVSADLIYGVALPEAGAGARYLAGGPVREQSPQEAAAEARRVAETGVTHVSAYSLTIEPGTRFGELSRRGKLPMANEDVVADAFFAIEEALGSAGLEHYEISNYARPGDEARHNLGYWRGHDYLGLGCAAFGTISGGASGQPRGWALRYRNMTDPSRYMRAALAKEADVESEEALSPETRLRERIMLGLRLKSGFDLADAVSDLGGEVWTDARRAAAARLVAREKLDVQGDRVRIPRDAWVLADGIAAELF